MSKYATNTVFDLKVYPKGALHLESDKQVSLFNIETATTFSIKYGTGGGLNRFIVEDCMIDEHLFNEILQGYYNGKKLSIVGETIFRDESSKDHDAILTITEAEIESYEFHNKIGSLSKSNIVFSFSSKCSDDLPNGNIRIGDSWL